MAWYHRVHLSTMWKMMCFIANIRSASACLLKLSGSSADAMLCGRGRARFRHTAHVCVMDGVTPSAAFGTPALSSRRAVEAADACHQRMCNFRSERLIWAALPRHESRITRALSKWDQSSAWLGPAAAFVNRRRARCSWPGPRPRRAELGLPPSVCASGFRLPSSSLGTGSLLPRARGAAHAAGTGDLPLAQGAWLEG